MPSFQRCHLDEQIIQGRKQFHLDNWLSYATFIIPIL